MLWYVLLDEQMVACRRHALCVRPFASVQSVTKSGSMSKRQFDGLFDVFRKIVKTDGIVGLYRGFMISCVSIAVYRGCYFGFFDSLKPVVLQGAYLCITCDECAPTGLPSQFVLTGQVLITFWKTLCA